MEVRLITVKDAELETVIYGSGTPIVLLAGNGRSHKSFDSLISHLIPVGFKPITINLRGIGCSKGSLEGITLRDLAADVAGVIENLNLKPVLVLGHAFGNRVARCLATDRPDLVKSVILLAAGGKVVPEIEVLDALKKMLDPSISEREKRDLRRFFFSPSTNSEVMGIKHKRWPVAASAHSKASRAISVDYWWNAGCAPLLVIQGLDDLVAPPGNGRLLKKELGDRVTLVELTEAGHLLQYEKPEEIAHIVSSYIL